MRTEPAGSGRTTGASAPAAVFATLRADHRRVLARLRKLERVLDAPTAATGRGPGPTPESDAALRLFLEWLSLQFESHMATEDEALFPALAVALPAGSEFVAPLHAEHRELRLMVETLRATLALPAGARRDERLRVDRRDLFELLRIHIRKEEALVFGIAERVLAPAVLDQLAAHREGRATPEVRSRTSPTRSKGMRQ